MTPFADSEILPRDQTSTNRVYNGEESTTIPWRASLEERSCECEFGIWYRHGNRISMDAVKKVVPAENMSDR